MDVYVIRHTRLAIDNERCYGQSEVELADSFADEAKELKLQLPDSFCAVYSSPLQRCTALAQTLSTDFETSPALLEYHFGDWELMRWNDIDQQQLDQWMNNFVEVGPPSGETLVAMSQRVAGFITELRKLDHQRVLLVTHGGVIRCIWACLLNIPLDQIFKISVGYGDSLNFKLGEDPQHDLITPPAH